MSSEHLPSVSPFGVSSSGLEVHQPEDIAQKDTGQMGPRRVKPYYPEFGEKTAKDEKSSWKVAALKVSVVGILLLGGIGIGFLVGGIPGAAIGGAIATGIIVTAALCTFVFDKMAGHRFLLQLPEEGQHEVYKEQDPYKLGHYYESDLRLTATADEGFEWKKKLIESAEETIELSANFAGGSSFQEVLEILDKKMATNSRVKTHMIISVDLLEEKDNQKLSELKKKFAKRLKILQTDRHFKMQPMPHTEENHVKMLVVDGKYFVSGGTGIHPRLSHDKYNPAIHEKESPTGGAKVMNFSFRDMDIVGESLPLSSVMRKQFFNLYRLWEIRTKDKMVKNRYFTVEGIQGNCQKFVEEPGLLKGVRLKFVVGGPEHSGNNPIEKEYIKRIGKAKKEVRLANWSFNPTKKMKKSLRRASDEGVKLVGYVGGHGGNISDVIVTAPNRPQHYLLEKVYEANVPNQTYHKKVATFDDSHMIIGSFNLSKKSAKFDHEVAFVIKDERVTKLCKDVLKEDASQATKKDRKKILQDHFWSKIVSDIVRPFVQNFL